VTPLEEAAARFASLSGAGGEWAAERDRLIVAEAGKGRTTRDVAKEAGVSHVWVAKLWNQVAIEPSNEETGRL
jgi:hypothetical protein